MTQPNEPQYPRLADRNKLKGKRPDPNKLPMVYTVRMHSLSDEQRIDIINYCLTHKTSINELFIELLNESFPSTEKAQGNG
jgi:hypothetical protein